MADNNNNNTKKQEYKSPFLLSDEEIRKLGVKEHNFELYRRKHYQQQFSILTWYEKLKNHTFRTVAIPMTWEHAHALINSHHHRCSQDDSKQIQDIKHQINKVIEDNFRETGAFLKLDTRSGKDVPVYDFENEDVQKLVLEELSRIPQQDRNSNSLAVALTIATNKYLKLTSADRAIYILTKSQRVAEDLGKMTGFGKELFKSNLILREWYPEMSESPGNEFRAFVYENKLNAVSQYFDFAHFPHIEQFKSEIQTALQEFHESIKDDLSTHQHYVIDFFVQFTKDENNQPVKVEKVYVIELNPFHIGAGACLFSWKTDRPIFVGEKPFDFRIIDKSATSKPDWNPLDIMPIQWQKFLESRAFPKRDDKVCLIQ